MAVFLLNNKPAHQVRIGIILSDLFRETEFEQIRETGKFNTILGTLGSYYAKKT
jgi:hypothetical protein